MGALSLQSRIESAFLVFIHHVLDFLFQGFEVVEVRLPAAELCRKRAQVLFGRIGLTLCRCGGFGCGWLVAIVGVIQNDFSDKPVCMRQLIAEA